MKPIQFNSEYIIYDDGKVWSLKTGKFLQPIHQNKDKKHYQAYDLRRNDVGIGIGKRQKMLIARLVYFHYGEHKCKNIDLLGKVVLIDDLAANLFHISNLKIETNSEISHRAGLNRKPQFREGKIPNSELKNIMLLSTQYSKNQIAKVYNVSSMSVLRFLRRNGIKKATSSVA